MTLPARLTRLARLLLALGLLPPSRPPPGRAVLALHILDTTNPRSIDT